MTGSRSDDFAEVEEDDPEVRDVLAALGRGARRVYRSARALDGTIGTGTARRYSRQAIRRERDA